MALKHGINTVRIDAPKADAVEAISGIPVFVGAWPCHLGKGYVDGPQLVHTFEEAKELGGWSDEWFTAAGAPRWTLCEAAYGFFKLGGMSPAVFVNVFNPKNADMNPMKTVSDLVPTNKKVTVTGFTEIGSVSKQNGEEMPSPMIKNEDYTVEESSGVFTITIINDIFSAGPFQVDGFGPDFTAITAETITNALGKIDYCKGRLNVVPDLIAAPGWSENATVAAAMAAKAADIGGIFTAKAVVDLSSATVKTVAAVSSAKTAAGLVDENEIVCWPMAKADGRLFHLSTLLCAVMARVDAENDDCPSVSPSNVPVDISGAFTYDGTEVFMTPAEADTVSVDAGVVTLLNFGGWRTWGNYTAYKQDDAENDYAKDFIANARMLDYVGNRFAHNHWADLDSPMTRVHIDAVLNSFNAWLAALIAEGKLLGGEAVFHPASNSASDLLSGKFTIETKMASPVPMQRIDHEITAVRDYILAAFADEQ